MTSPASGGAPSTPPVMPSTGPNPTPPTLPTGGSLPPPVSPTMGPGGGMMPMGGMPMAGMPGVQAKAAGPTNATQSPNRLWARIFRTPNR